MRVMFVWWECWSFLTNERRNRRASKTKDKRRVDANAKMAEIHVNQRLSYGGDLCTVRYVGRIPHWPEDLALGVEWDTKQGKHDGQHGGVRYFDGGSLQTSR